MHHPAARAYSILSLLIPLATSLGQPGEAGQPAPAPARPTSLPIRDEELAYWPPAARAEYADLESRAMAIPSREQFLKWHQLLASEPHIAGTVGDERTIARLMEAFRGMGLEVEQHDIWPLLAKPISASLEVVEPDKVEISLKESPVAGDPFSGAADLTFGWNAYGATGDVTAGIVYANYGTKQDFEQLKKLGVDCTGKIVLARYGGNYRGLKVRFAQAAGAAGIIIFTDPGDSGYMKGLVYPEGGFANDCCIQRGSVTFMDQPGDPLTVGSEATKDGPRATPDEVELPRIPVQPVGWGAAKEIMSRMTGPAVPEGWQGGLPFTYRLEGGPALKVRLAVKQERAITKTSNVIARLPGREHPEQMVIIGAHHDAWNCGASDPLAGTICVLEAARAFSELAKTGWRPARTIVFAAWGAEEFGIIGSTEWVEGHRQALIDGGIAYLNLDMAAMGPDFGASASPSLRRLISEVARAVPQARASDQTSVFEAWNKRSPGPTGSPWPDFGSMGGGSDHVAFNCHALVASVAFGAGGSKGWSYHSAYDTLPWYWKVVGDDYEPCLMLSRMGLGVIGRLASAPMLQLDGAQSAIEMRRELVDLSRRGLDAGVLTATPNNALASELVPLDLAARQLETAAAAARDRMLKRLEAGPVDPADLKAYSAMCLLLDRGWSRRSDAGALQGLPGREWYVNLFASTDPDSGYGAWILPGLRGAIERKDARGVQAAIRDYQAALEQLLGYAMSGTELKQQARPADE
ncbi:MAG: M20/M25/M40 family metallo-hydrolase [Phycisphaerales bacterium]|nr:M20/M25/M40 family metallo-hydrolase [Phycisphaerales bacterium]